MPIDIQCTACGQRLRVGDALAGKQANCPKCKAKITIPAAGPAEVKSSAPAAAAPVAKPAVAATPVAPPDGWHLQTSDGQSYGPIPKLELDAWFAESRITADSQLLPPGGQQWLAASQIYSSLSQPVQAVAAQPATPQFPSADPRPIETTPAIPAFVAAGTGDFASANPYAAPLTPVGESSIRTGERSSELAVVRRLLAETRPWTMFLAIMGFIFGGLLFLWLAYMAWVILQVRIVDVNVRSARRSLMLVFGVGFSMMYPFVCMLTYAQRIGEFQRSGSVGHFEKVLLAHRKFWRIAGITTIILLVFELLGLAITFLA